MSKLDRVIEEMLNGTWTLPSDANIDLSGIDEMPHHRLPWRGAGIRLPEQTLRHKIILPGQEPR